MNPIKLWVLRTMMKGQTGVMKTLPKKDLVDFNVNMTIERLLQNRIDPSTIKTPDQLDNIIKQIEAPRNVQTGIRNTESAKVFDLKGKEIPPGSQIMGGQEVKNTTGSLMSVPKKKGLAGMEYETDAGIKARLQKENKESIARIKNKTMIDDAIDNASPGFANDIKYDAQLVADDLAEKKFNKDFYDLDQKQQMDLYDEAYTGLSKQRFKGMKKPDPEDMADGGIAGMLGERPGYQDGSSVLDLSAFGFTPEHAAAIDEMDKNFTGSQLDYSAAATRDMVNRASNPVTATISAIGNVAARPAYDFYDAAKEYSKKGYQGEFGFTPRGAIDFGKNMLSLGKEFVGQRPGTMMAGALKGGIQSLGTKLGEGIYDVVNPQVEDDLDDFDIKSIVAKDLLSKKQIEQAKTFQKMKEAELAKEAATDGGGGGKDTDGGSGTKGFSAPTKQGQSPRGSTTGGNGGGGGGKGFDAPSKQGQSPRGSRTGKNDGGRIGFKKGGMKRRTFLKMLGGAMAIPIVSKFLKPFKIGKTMTKVPVIKTADVPGKPEWFDQLVNKVILEGDDMTKQFATKEREIVHGTKIDKDNYVRVTQDLDQGSVRVEYDAPTNMGEDTVQLEFKPGIADESTRGKKPRDEFEASEVEPAYVGGPEDTDMEFVGEASGPGLKFISSDVSKLKEYATGKGPTMKEFLKIKERKDAVKKINEDQMEAAEYIAGKYGDGPDLDDFASGGIARMLGE